MDLFSLVAKLTLDSSEYSQALDQAEKEAKSFDMPDGLSLDLDNTDFMDNIGEAQDEAESFEGPEDQEISLDTKEFTDGISTAESDAQDFQTNLGAIWDGIKTGLAVAGIGAAISGIFTQLADCVNLAAKLGDDVDKGSKRLNISTKAYQEWGHVLGQSGANINDFQRGIASINKLLGGGEVSETATKAFEKLGLSTTKANGELKTTEEYLTDTVKALADFEGTSEERGALVEAIFGRGGNQLNAMLDEGSKGIQALINEAHEYGLVMTDEEIKNSVNYGDAVANMNSAMEALKTSFATGILPVLTDAVNMVTKIIAFFNGRSSSNNLSDQFKNTDKELSKDLITIEGTSEAAMDMVDKLFKMGEAEKMTAEQEAEWRQTAQWLIDNIPSLSEKIDLDTKSIDGNRESIQNNIEEWKRLSKERAIAAAKESKYQAMLDANTEALDKQASARAKSDEALEKQYERIAEVNNLLKNNSNLADVFGATFGTTTVTKDAQNLQQMLDWMTDVGYEFADTRTYQDLTEEYIKLQTEQRNLQSESEKYDKQLADAQTQYEYWCNAIEELYDSEEESAKGAKTSVDSLQESIKNLPNKKTIQIEMLGELPTMHTHAIGADYIPYDNYPALLHRGEKVITATEARRGEGGLSVSDLSRLQSAIETAISNGMQNMNTAIYLDGKEIATNVSKRLVNSISARRFQG